MPAAGLEPTWPDFLVVLPSVTVLIVVICAAGGSSLRFRDIGHHVIENYKKLLKDT